MLLMKNDQNWNDNRIRELKENNKYADETMLDRYGRFVGRLVGSSLACVRDIFKSSLQGSFCEN